MATDGIATADEVRTIDGSADGSGEPTGCPGESDHASGDRPEGSDDRRNGAVQDRGVRAVLEIERGGSCPIDEFDGEVIDVDVRYGTSRCLGEVELRECEETCSATKQFSSPICDHCPGIVFSRYGCIPRFLETGDRSFIVETRLDDVETLSTLVNELQGRSERVTVRSLTSNGASDGTEWCSIDLSSLTPKQREAVSRAQDRGHYDPDAETSLTEIARDVGISTSALSQRLQRAEANVLRQLNCECSCWLDP